MPNKSLILTIVAAIIALGVLMSGCNRDNRTAMNNPDTRRGARPARRGARPAEVLSSQVYRPPERHHSEPARQMAYAPGQSPFVGPIYTDASLSQAPLYVPVGQPVAVRPSPELAMARATLPPPPAPSAIAPVRQIPIPELEPVRYQRQPSRPAGRPVAEIMMSANQDHRRQEIQRALEPLALAPAVPERGWVSSPATAMRPGYY